jgi:hypothetical protein
VSHIKEIFSGLDWIHDKRVLDGCSRRRPDLLLELDEQILIIEVDENQHGSYDCSCENKRLMEISRDLTHKPIVFIRFNPDAYTEGATRHKSPWRVNKKSGIVMLHDKKEWNTRMNALVDQVNYWLENTTDKTVEVINLFFDTP